MLSAGRAGHLAVTLCRLALLLLPLAFLPVGAAEAQLNNRPFSFGTPDGSPGMSFAGRQAIINQKLQGATPDNLLRGPGGSLVSVEKGPGGVAIVQDSSGAPLPGFRGTSWRNPGDFAGSFNGFFVPGDGGFSLAFRYASASNLFNSWTSLLMDADRVRFTPYGGVSPIDDWIAMIAFLAY